jgi:signal transduction histidine kinase
MVDTANLHSGGGGGPRAALREALATAFQRMRRGLARLAPQRKALLRASEIEQVREQERRHLAQELHDVMSGELTAARLQLATIRSRLAGHSADIEHRLEQLDATLRTALALKRRVLHGLEPDSLGDHGLTASLEAFVREFTSGSALRVTIDLDDVTADRATELAIYRLVQESLTNIVKYAAASEVTVVLRDRVTDIAVSVRDDGRGFDAAQADLRGHGLDGMRQRIRKAGGQLTIDSEPGRGTRIAAHLPKHAIRP